MPDTDSHPAAQPHSPNDADKRFRVGRLLSIIGVVLVLLAAAAATVDILVLGPLEGRFL